MSKASYRLYNGYLKGMRHEHGLKRRAKTALYCYRVALTGIHLLNTGQIEPNLTTLAPIYNVDVQDLIDFKREYGEKCQLPEDLDADHMAAFDGLENRLLQACEQSRLPAQPTNCDAMEAWLVGHRLRVQ